jgi:hypothetical protein
MPGPSELYPVVRSWLYALAPGGHQTALAALAHLVCALLVAQSLRPSALMRTLASPPTVPARQRYKRVRRFWTRPWLAPAWLTPRLVPAALQLVAPDGHGPTAGLTHLALDSVRCGPWELFVLGVVWHGRVLPVSWAVLAYPWPKGQFTPTVCELIRAVAAVWPAARPVHLLADRAFPSRPLFRTLKTAQWGWTIRLRARSWVRVAGRAQWARALLDQATVGRWRLVGGAYGGGDEAVPGQVVVGRGLPVRPFHQRGPASQQVRARQHGRRRAHVAGKHPGRAPDGSVETDSWLLLFTSHASWRAAVGSYRRRWAIEGSFRDAQGGWDGQHGWDLEPVVAKLGSAEAVAHVAGLWALGTLLQSWLGDQVSQATAPARVQAIAASWVTTGRLSVWARGQFGLREPSGQLRAWVIHTLRQGAQRLAGPDASPAARPARLAKAA